MKKLEEMLSKIPDVTLFSTTVSKDDLRLFVRLKPARKRQYSKDEIMKIVRACAEEHRLQGIKSVKLRKAGRKLFVIVHFLADKSLSLHHTEEVKQWVVERVIKAYPEVDVTILFSGR